MHSLGLAPVVYSINTSTASSTRETPYEVVFGQPPRSDFEMWKELSNGGVEDEENLPDDFLATFSECELHRSQWVTSNDFTRFFMSVLNCDADENTTVPRDEDPRSDFVTNDETPAGENPQGETTGSDALLVDTMITSALNDIVTTLSLSSQTESLYSVEYNLPAGKLKRSL